jgi:hypothetical protein
VSILASRASLPGRSKMPPEVVETPRQVADVPLQLAEH